MHRRNYGFHESLRCNNLLFSVRVSAYFNCSHGHGSPYSLSSRYHPHTPFHFNRMHVRVRLFFTVAAAAAVVNTCAHMHATRMQPYCMPGLRGHVCGQCCVLLLYSIVLYVGGAAASGGGAFEPTSRRAHLIERTHSR